MPLPKWGGCPLLYALHIAAASLCPCLSSSLPCSNRVRFSDKTGKNGQKLIFICLLWCFLGKIGDRNGQKQKFVLLSWLSWCSFHPLLWWRWSCPLGAGGAGCKGFRCPAVCVPSLCPLSCFVLWWVACRYALV